MKTKRMSNVSATVLFALLLQAWLATPSWAQTYTFRNVADTEGLYTNFGGAPVINNDGHVAFVASLDSGVQGIFFGPDPISDTIADDQGPYGDLNYPTINDEGDVAFRAFIDPTPEHFIGGSGIFTGDDPENDAVVSHFPTNNPPDPWGSFFLPSINNDGTVAFDAITGTGGFGIYTGDDPETDAYADNHIGGPFSNLYGASINDAGTVAFFADLAAGGGGIFTGDDLIDDTVADTSGPYIRFGLPAINNHGTVAFLAELDVGGFGVFMGPDPVADAVATPVGPYRSFEADISINNNGAVVFVADLDAGGFGIFTGPNPQLHKVIAKDDPLFDSTVTFVSLFRENLNDNGEVAFMYELADGRRGVAVASPGSLARTVEEGDAYDDVRLASAAGHDTVARLRNGTAGDDRSVSLSFAPGGDLSINGGVPVGDVLDLSGTGDDTYVLELTYSDDDLLAAGVVNETDLLILWRDPSDGVWKNAVLGNTPPNSQAFLGLSFDEYVAGTGIVELGDYGNDPDSNTIWAVLNHNSLFALAPVSGSGSLSGDYNQNGVVDAADYTLWRDRLGSGTSLANDDTAGVGPDDYIRWKNRFGQSLGSGMADASLSPSPVPEPATWWLAVLGIFSLTFARRNRAVNLAAGALLLLPGFTAAQAYSFINIADSSGAYNASWGIPTVNNARTVAFAAGFDAGGSGIFTSSSGARTTIVDSTASFVFNFAPSIDESGAVAFYSSQDLGDGGSGIYKGSGGPLTPIVIAGMGYVSLTGNPVISPTGTVVFSALNTTESRIGLYAGSGSEVTTIADEDGPLGNHGFGVATINSAGTAAFRHTYDEGGEGVFAGSNGAITTIAETGEQFSSFGANLTPSINDKGVVAFYAFSAGGGISVHTGSGGPVTTIADNSGSFSGFGDPAINDDGTVVFLATLDGGGQGIYTGDDPVADKVIRSGDSLFGSNVSDVSFARGLNDNGDIAFRYYLSNGISGIALAVADAPNSVSGDYNQNGVVDAADYTVWRNNLGSGTALPNDDTPGVGSDDYDRWKINFGATSGPAGGANAHAPEPDSAALLLVGLAMFSTTALQRPRTRSE